MKKLKYGFHFVAGRSKGRIVSYHRGGGEKKSYYFIDRFRFLYDVPAKVYRLAYLPRSASKLTLLIYSNGFVSYVPAISGVLVGNYLKSSTFFAYEALSKGDSVQLQFVKSGSRVSSIELYPGFGSSIARAAGLFATVLRKYSNMVLLRLSSGEFRFFSSSCFCTIGGVLSTPFQVSRTHNAGFRRRLGWRPVVRGRAMNPVDHPHGGRTNGGMVPTTPWARHVKGQKTSRSTSALRLNYSRL
jgi:large subunit ribosomal protein L2